MYVILTNYVNWHRENLQPERQHTGNLKIQFEWVPWETTRRYTYNLNLDIFACINVRVFPKIGHFMDI